jgi:PPIC-type PPIASE domain
VNASHRPLWLLGLGAAIGVGLAARGLLIAPDRPTAPVPADVVAQVNGHAIQRADFERVVVGAAGDRRDGLDPARHQQLLDRLIEEELLVQRALAIDLPRIDRKTRNDLVQAMIATIVNEADAHQPTDDELAAFFTANRGFFRRPDRARARQIFCRQRTPDDPVEAERRCTEASRQWQAGADYVTLAREHGDPVAPPLPDTLLPATKLTEYIGPTAAQAILTQPVGTVSAALRVAGGFRVVQLLEREADDERGFEDVREQVRAEMRRRAGDDALRRYLDALRAGASISIAPPVPAAP